MIYSQKTYKGRTAGGYLKNAEVSEMQSGDYAVTSPDLNGCTLMMSVNGDMIVSDFSGIVCVLELSGRAISKLLAMEKEADMLMINQ